MQLLRCRWICVSVCVADVVGTQSSALMEGVEQNSLATPRTSRGYQHVGILMVMCLCWYAELGPDGGDGAEHFRHLSNQHAAVGHQRGGLPRHLLAPVS